MTIQGRKARPSVGLRRLDRRSLAQWWPLVALGLAFASFRAPVSGEEQALPGDPAPRDLNDLLRRLAEAPSDEEPMPREVRENFIDKVKIAEEREQKIVGLAELGNPHMPSGVLLQRAARDPERSQVDAAALRERLIRVVERRGNTEAPDKEGGDMGPAEVRQRSDESPEDSSSRERSATRKALAWICAALAGGLLALLAFLVARRPISSQ